MYTGTVQRIKSSYVLNGKLVPTFQNWKDLDHIFDLNDASFDHALFEMEFRLLGEIFRNVSFYMIGAYTCPLKKSPDVFCDDYMTPMLVLLPTGIYEGSNFRLHDKNLRFVSCGPVSKEMLPLIRLFSIFDRSTWIGIQLMLLVLPLISTFIFIINKYNLKYLLVNNIHSKIYRLLNLLTLNSISSVSALLEQGDPFSNSL